MTNRCLMPSRLTHFLRLTASRRRLFRVAFAVASGLPLNESSSAARSFFRVAVLAILALFVTQTLQSRTPVNFFDRQRAGDIRRG